MKVTENKGVKILTLEIDHLDALNSEELKKKLINQTEGTEKIVINMDLVEFVDSSGLGVILTLYRHINEQGGTMVLACVTDTVKVLFKLVRLSHIIQVFDSEFEAVSKV